MKQDVILSLEDLYKVLHVGKRKAKYILDSGIIPCIDTKKKTHRYIIKKSDVIKFMESGVVFEYPSGLFSSGRSSEETKGNLISAIDNSFAKEWYSDYLIDEKDILSFHDVERLTGFSKEAVRRWVVSGDLIGIQNGNRMIIPKSSLIEWISSAKYLLRPQKSNLQIKQMQTMIKEKQQA